MRILSINAGFEIWRDEAAELQPPQIPDAEIPVIALVGIYETLTRDKSQRTSYDWRRSVIGCHLTKDSLFRILPESERDDLMDDGEMPIDWARSESKERESSQARCERAAILDGLPDDVASIPANEYYLARKLGHAIHNAAVGLAPLSLYLDVASGPLEAWFPDTLRTIEDGSYADFRH